MKKILLTALTALSAFTLAACGDDKEVVKIGVNGADGAQWPILEENIVILPRHIFYIYLKNILFS